MKLATRLLVPALALGLAACGSSTSSNNSQPSSPSGDQARSGIAPLKQSPQQAEALRKATAKLKAATATPRAKQGAAAKTPQNTTTAARGARLPKQTTAFAVGAAGVSTIAPSVEAGAPFRLALSSVDGKVHKVVVGTPSPRTVSVPAGAGTVVDFPSVAAGKYSLSVDGKRTKPTLSVVAPRG